MATERLKIPGQEVKFPTAGYGSVAPPWIKADLLADQPQNITSPPKTHNPLQWLRKQLGWR